MATSARTSSASRRCCVSRFTCTTFRKKIFSVRVPGAHLALRTVKARIFAHALISDRFTLNRTASRVKISLFIPCFVDQFYPQVGMSIVQVLERLGHSVDYPDAQTCCGQPAFNSGYWAEARTMAERQMAVFRDAENVVIASGSCGAMVKVFYPELFHGQPREAEAKALEI